MHPASACRHCGATGAIDEGCGSVIRDFACASETRHRPRVHRCDSQSSDIFHEKRRGSVCWLTLLGGVAAGFAEPASHRIAAPVAHGTDGEVALQPRHVRQLGQALTVDAFEVSGIPRDDAQ